MKNQETYAIGLMSGTSLDGLDLVLAAFTEVSGHWRYSILKADTRSYSQTWKQDLTAAPEMSGEDLIALHKSYGKYLGEQVNDFLKDTSLIPRLVASHGHTVFHQPATGKVFQLGDGNVLAAITGMPVVFDFRSLDVALGGQGAPLVPAGDRWLFSEYAYCLNLGGFANISYETNQGRIAFDLCPVNLAQSYVIRPTGKEYDKDGETGRRGSVDTVLLKCLDRLDYYRLPPPKSLGREWLESHFYPCLDKSSASTKDKLRTVYEHISKEICRTIQPGPSSKMLVTGGGAHNIFLMELLSKKCPVEIVVPDEKIINYKEALIFAFLGVLRMENRTNCLASVTGAKKDSSSGLIVYSD
ncbi:MAG: anhydro-N-acetylmuramic acid kinase [Bacteroidales bacterium]|nr:anhydro-N-acetylmuramic acid kinase [Bacteroidales bacterium]